jgi:SpoVK/Ycf46/Vps4 family AAA+-type ATPase
MKENKMLLFLDDFDEIMMQRTAEMILLPVILKLRNLFFIISVNLKKKECLMVGSANSVSEIDEEILAPGRFDVMIPIFPPNASERSEIILYAMTKGLEEDSLLYKILKNNKADKVPFWHDCFQMKAFSNTMLIDFTQSLKKRIKNLYQRTRNEKLKIDQKLLDGALRDAAGKLTEEYLDQVARFLQMLLSIISMNSDSESRH